MTKKTKNLLFWGGVGVVSAAYIVALGFKCFQVGHGFPIAFAAIFLMGTVVFSSFGCMYWKDCLDSRHKSTTLGLGICDILNWAVALLCIVCLIQIVLPGPDLYLLGMHRPYF